MTTLTREELCSRLKKELSFQFLDKDDAPVMVQYLNCRQVVEGTVLWNEGDPCGELVFIVSGKLEVKKETEFSGKSVIVGVYGAGSIVGELCILKGMPRAVSAIALTECDLLTLDTANFDALLAEHPEVGTRLLKGMLATVSLRLDKAFARLAAIF